MRCFPSYFLACALILACNPAPERASNASTQQSRVAVTDDQRRAVEDTLRKLVQGAIAAQNKGDIKPIRSYYAPSAISIQSGRLIRDIDAMFAEYDSEMKTAGGALPRITANVERVDVLSPSAAVATTTTRGTMDSAGKQLKWGHVHTGVWQNQNGKWQMLVEHASLVPDSTAGK